MRLRGVDLSVVYDGPKYHNVTLQWVCPDGVAFADPAVTATVAWGAAAVTLANPGTSTADVRYTLAGPLTDPELQFAQSGDPQGLAVMTLKPLVIPAGKSVIIETATREIYWLDTGVSLYPIADIWNWSWNQLRVGPINGSTMKFGPNGSGTGTMKADWRHTWLMG